MVKQGALMESLSSNLHGFLKQIGMNLKVPQRKFLRDGFVGLVRAGHPIVCQMHSSIAYRTAIRDSILVPLSPLRSAARRPREGCVSAGRAQ